MITFNNIVERFKVFADAHFFVKSFSFGSPDDVDLSKFTSFPLMHLVYTGATYDAGTKTYNLEVYILDVPADKTKKTDRQKEVVSDAEQCAEDIIADIKNGGNIFLFAQDYEVVNATTTPLEEETKNVLSGVLLDLSVAIPYEWDACNAPIDGVSPEGGDEVAYARRGILRMLTEDGSTDVLSVRTIKVTNGTLTDDGDGVVTLDTGGASTLVALDDVQITNPFEGQSIRWDDGLQRWVKDGRTTALFDEFRKGLETTINNGEGTESELKLEQTKATVQTGKTKVVLTETSPGDIEFVVATDADGDTAFTALHLDGSSTANVADLLVKFGTYFKFEYGNFTQWIRPNSGVTQDTTIILPSTSGVLGRAEDIPTSVTNLTDVTSAGSGAIITDDERTKLEGVAPSATANETDAFLLDRANHTGTQAASTISDFDTEVSNNTDVAANTAKVGITTQQADDITANNAKVSLIAGGTTGQALVKSTNTDYDVEWADIAVDVQYHDRYATESETLRAGGAETIELYYSAQADGDGLAESASSDTPAAGYDIRRKLYYSEAGFADPDTGTWTQFTAIADNTTFANAKAALLAYLKERTGGTVPISLKMTWEEVAQAPAFTGLLNESYGSGAAAAYSVRRLNGNYTGAAIQVERSSDNTTQDIGFDVDGNLDESALTTFCTGTVCKVRSWFDQSGNGNDAVQTVHANQPTIYTGGAIVKENGRVAFEFDGTGGYLSNTNITGFSGKSQSVFLTAKNNTTSSSEGRFYFSLFTSSVLTGTVRTLTQEPYLRFQGTIQDYTNNHSFGVQELYSLVCPSPVSTINDYDLYRDGTLLTPNSLSGSTVNDINATDLRIGTNPTNQTGAQIDGNLQELIFYNADKSTDRTSIESNIGDYFTQNTPLLDTYTGAAAAYSLRKLRTAYSGSAIRVRRASDNTEQDIGFNVFGELDTVSLASFCSGTDGFVKVWYEQSGNGVNASENATNEMPKIYDGTTGVVTKNGKPAVEFDGANDKLTTGALTTGTDFYGTVVMAPTATATRYALGNTANYNTLFLARTQVSGSNFTPVMGSGFIVDNSGQSFPIGTQVLITSQKSGTQGQCFANGQSNGATTVNNPSLAAFMFTTYGGTYWKGTMQEIVFYGDDQSANRTNIEDNINTFYSIY